MSSSSSSSSSNTRLEELSKRFEDEDEFLSAIEMHELCVLRGREVERLTAIVERLPITLDDVRVTPGMTLFYLRGDGIIDCAGRTEGNPGAKWNFYSTREAAEAANKENE